MNPETWASIVAAVAAVAGGVWTQRAASRANHSTAVVATEPQQRERDLEAFKEIKDSLREDLEEMRGEIAEERAGRARDRRTLDAVLRYLRQTLVVLRSHDIEPPAPDPADAPELAGHGIP